MCVTEVYRKLFLSSYFFTIALRKRGETPVWNQCFHAAKLMGATRKKWFADPILADHEGKTYMFYEALVGTKGRIECVCLDQNDGEWHSSVILEDENHYSYPFVFCYNGQWYMIPESSGASQVRLYRAIAFPDQWALEGVLLHQKSVDTTVFMYKGQWYMQTFLLCEGSESVVPQIYRLEWTGAALPELHKMKWESYDPLLCRGAGPCFRHEGKLIRPSQENGEHQYGNAVRFYEIEIEDDVYRETLVHRLSPENIKANVWLDGLHTYAQSERFEAIDIRIRKFDLLKVPRTVFHRCVQLLGRR